jgi:hypothetical protein
MIFKLFTPEDIVAGRTTRVASGFWPEAVTNWSASFFTDNYWSLTSSATLSPSYGASYYDIRKTMYYLDVFPNSTYSPNDPYLSIAYGHIAGDVGSGSFDIETASIKAAPTKAIYNQYKNILLGSSDEDGRFTFKSASTTVNADEIFVVNFSSYKMKDKIDEGAFEISFTGSKGTVTLRDDSPYQTQASSNYNMVTGSLDDTTTTSPTYHGLGLLYPNDGVLVLNATRLNEVVGLTAVTVNTAFAFNYSANCIVGTETVNHKVLADSLNLSNRLVKVRKSEYVPARHYFVRVKNRDFNYSNNPTYVYDGTDGVHAEGTIRNEDFITDPRTYVTTIGLYNESNELVAVAKLSRPAIKTFDNELLIKVRLDF